jgi:hypothetical protein
MSGVLNLQFTNMRHLVVWETCTNVSEESDASIFRAEEYKLATENG